MLKEIRTPCRKSETEEYSKSEESGKVFLLCGFMWAFTSLRHSLAGILYLPRCLTVNSTPPLPYWVCKKV